MTSAFFTIVLTALYILFMFYLVKPFLRKIGEFYNKQETVSKTLVAFIFLVLIIFVLHYRNPRDPCAVRRFLARGGYAGEPEVSAV